MDFKILDELHKSGEIGDDSYKRISLKSKGPVSLEFEIKTLLYLSIILFTYTLGTLAYRNIDTIGHTVIISVIGIICLASFIYSYKFKPKFSNIKVQSISHLYDYIVLLGALSMITFFAYLQFRYEFFGTKYGLASFITMSILFFAAYIFDHIGVLSLAITNLALWMGITITPKSLLLKLEFKSFELVTTGLFLAAILIVAGELSKRFNFKAHFRFTYLNFGVNVAFISLLYGLFNYTPTLMWFLFLIIATIALFIVAVRERSFYFSVLITGYFYIGLSYYFISLTDYITRGENQMYIVLFYFIFTAIALIFFLIHLNKKLNERI